MKISQAQSEIRKIPTFKDQLSVIMDTVISFAVENDIAWILARPEHELSKRQEKKLTEAITRLKKGEPLAHIIGEREFYGLPFFVCKDVLIPRPETELMVEMVKNTVTSLPAGPLTVIDIGTGSGCIITAIAHELKSRQDTRFIGLDISTRAQAVARKNARRNLMKTIRFFKNDLLTPGRWSTSLPKTDAIIITANLPYLTLFEYRALPGLKFEPRKALVSGNDGLNHYRRLYKQFVQLVTSLPGRRFELIMEFDPRQVGEMKQIWKNFSINIKQDLRKKNRFITIKCGT